MIQQGKTAINILQELIAILTTRKETCEKILEKKPDAAIAEKLTSISEQSMQFIRALMEELTQFGDAVMAEVSRDNQYHMLWKQTMENIEHKNPAELSQNFMQMEEALKNIYNEFVDSSADMPTSLHELLIKQAESLSKMI